MLGASGFLGRALTAQLVPLAGSVAAVSRGTASVSVPELQGAEVLSGDVTSGGDMHAVLLDADVVFVMAGMSGAAASWDAPVRSLEVNLGGLTTVLEALRAVAPAARVVFPSSRLVYGPASALPVAESASLRPQSPYALHKSMCEQILALYRDQYGVPYVVARLTNPYGSPRNLPHQAYNVMSAMIARASAGEELVVFGDGSQLRDYIYVADAVRALAILAPHADRLTVNVGSGSGTPFVEVVESIVRVAHGGRIVHREWPAAYATVESGDFIADVSRARSLGVPAGLGLAEGLRQSLAR